MHQAVMQTVLAVDKASYADCDEALIVITVTDDTGPVEDVTVRVEVTDANGVRLGGGCMTGADGVGNLRYEVNAGRGGVGTYTVDTTVYKPGFESGGGSTTFEVIV